MFPFKRDFINIREGNPLESLQNIAREEPEIDVKDLKILASISRLAAAIFAVTVFFCSSSWITCGIVWILSHDLYFAADYMHNGESSQWYRDCLSHKMALAFGKAWLASWFNGSSNVTERAAQQVFWNGVKPHFISFKIYAFIKKHLG